MRSVVAESDHCSDQLESVDHELGWDEVPRGSHGDLKIYYNGGGLSGPAI